MASIMTYKINKVRYVTRRAKRDVSLFLWTEIAKANCVTSAFLEVCRKKLWLFRLSYTYAAFLVADKLFNGWVTPIHKRIEMSEVENEVTEVVQEADLAVSSEVEAEEAARLERKAQADELHREFMSLLQTFERQALEGFGTLFRALGNVKPDVFDEAYKKHGLLLEDLRKRYVAHARRVLDKKLETKG